MIAPDKMDASGNPQQEGKTMKSQVFSRSIAVSGGKGGIGKSILCVNLAFALGAMGKKVALLDADPGPENTDFFCGVNPQHHLGHVIAGWKGLDEISIDLAPNVRLIPGGSGVTELSHLTIDSEDVIFSKLKELEESTDFLLIDTAAGTGDNATSIQAAAGDVIVIATPEPASIIGAYDSIKEMLKSADPKSIHIVVNKVTGIGDAEEVFHQIEHVAEQFQGHGVKFLGMIPHDTQLADAAQAQTPVVEFAPDSPSSRAIRLIANQIQSDTSHDSPAPSEYARSFWRRLTQTQ